MFQELVFNMGWFGWRWDVVKGRNWRLKAMLGKMRFLASGPLKKGQFLSGGFILLEKLPEIPTFYNTWKSGYLYENIPIF